MLMKGVNSQRLYQQIANQIAEGIQSGKFKPGRRLPAERDLAIEFAVSRSVIREALVALEIAVVPLALGLPVFAFIFSAANAALLAYRVRIENEALTWAAQPT